MRVAERQQRNTYVGIKYDPILSIIIISENNNFLIRHQPLSSQLLMLGGPFKKDIDPSERG